MPVNDIARSILVGTVIDPLRAVSHTVDDPPMLDIDLFACDQIGEISVISATCFLIGARQLMAVADAEPIAIAGHSCIHAGAAISLSARAFMA